MVKKDMINFKFFTEKRMQIICIVITMITFGIFGFYLGRKTIDIEKPRTEIVYVKGDKITDSIPYPVPFEVVKPADTADIIRQCVKDGIYTELFPEKIVTEYIEITKEDTAEIIRDWGTKRLYSEKIFDIDTIGSCTVNATIQYNRMSLLSYDYIPVMKQTTIHEYKIRAFSPYIGFGCIVHEDFSDIGNYIPELNAGFFIKEKYGINLLYGKSFKNGSNFYGASLLYKF